MSEVSRSQKGVGGNQHDDSLWQDKKGAEGGGSTDPRQLVNTADAVDNGGLKVGNNCAVNGKQKHGREYG